jgi:hypothetical protein
MPTPEASGTQFKQFEQKFNYKARRVLMPVFPPAENPPPDRRRAGGSFTG